MTPNLPRRVTAEFLGTLLLVATVVGSGIMAERLGSGNVALALLANTIATGAALVALILALGPLSGAHLNPVVSVADAIEGACRGKRRSRMLPRKSSAASAGQYWRTACSRFILFRCRGTCAAAPRNSSANSPPLSAFYV